MPTNVREVISEDFQVGRSVAHASSKDNDQGEVARPHFGLKGEKSNEYFTIHRFFSLFFEAFFVII